jgi:ATP-binding cassette subfamily B protein
MSPLSRIKAKSNRQLWIYTKRAFKEIIKAAPKQIGAMALAMFLVTVLPFANTLISTKVIDEIIYISTQNVGQITHALIWLIVLYVISDIFIQVLWSFISYFERDVYFKLGEYFTLQFLDKASTLDLYNYESPERNNLIKKAEESYSYRPQEFASRLLWTFGDVVEVLTSFGIVFFFSPFFFFVILITSIPAVVLNLRMNKAEWGIWGAKTEVKRKFDDTSRYLSSESELMELRIFGTRNYLFGQVKELFDSFFQAQRKIATHKAFLESASVIFSKIGTLAFWIFAISQILQGNITVGLFTFYASTADRFSTALSSVFRNITRSYGDIKYMSSYFDFLDLDNKIVPGKNRLERKLTPPRIEFKHVDFMYPGTEKPILENFELAIEPGEKVAFVGENGAGKSTIIKLLSRFYDVTSGEILIDGQDLRDIDTTDWYHYLGVLFQSFAKYEFLKVKDSIGIGDVNKVADDEAIETAAQKSGAAAFISRFKNKYDQILSKKYPDGIDLSGGQWQRIALARAFFRDAPILILDEPTSAIDPKGEYEIFEKLYEFSQGKTVIIISHRFSTVRKADRIFVVGGGKIIEQGSHAELMALNGKYAKAFNVQAEGYK